MPQSDLQECGFSQLKKGWSFLKITCTVSSYWSQTRGDLPASASQELGLRDRSQPHGTSQRSARILLLDICKSASMILNQSTNHLMITHSKVTEIQKDKYDQERMDTPKLQTKWTSLKLKYLEQSDPEHITNEGLLINYINNELKLTHCKSYDLGYPISEDAYHFVLTLF
ncbi:uncharacterized protein LOC103163754 isoform X2 [Cricetulus griseus]|uniref:Uncharacterized protein LOC103163754 isoform X2 n=1 Tax=Cricetulus griseus TaxID=10029 RepID=A0A9J7H6C3_CRIGR|nr:uncharacterized protein LOC103163754 isoform X2 [Cricetulus griseus]